MHGSDDTDDRERDHSTIQKALIERANYAPQGVKARKIEASLLEVMVGQEWLSCTSISRLIHTSEDRKTRARLDRLVKDGKVERRRAQGTHGIVYHYRRLRS
jgi:hypothetical protein